MKKFLPLLAALGLGLSASSCIVLAGAGAGYLISQEVTGDTHQAQVLRDVDSVWAQAQETVAGHAEDGIEVTDYPRRIEAVVDGADVEVEVQAYDLNRTIVKIKATRYLSRDSEIASWMLNEIIDDLGEDL